MLLQLIRHAALWLEYGDLRLLVDPMLSEAGALPPIQNTAHSLRNPLVPLPGPADLWLKPDAVLVTHVHPDHWDAAAAALLPKSLPILCQPGDEAVFSSAGFHSVTAVDRETGLGGIEIVRTSGRHGWGSTGQRMGPVSGYVLKAPGEPSVYIAGDTVYCDCVSQVLKQHRPDVTVVNAGGARFVEGKPITMTAEDVVDLCRYAPYTLAVAVHMEAVNHCLEARSGLRGKLQAQGLQHQVRIPGDGEWVTDLPE